MAIARYYSQKSGVWRSMEDPEPCKSSSSSSSSSSFSFEAFSRPLSRLLSDAQETGNRELSMAKAVWRRKPSRGHRLSIPHAINSNSDASMHGYVVQFLLFFLHSRASCPVTGRPWFTDVRRNDLCSSYDTCRKSVRSRFTIGGSICWTLCEAELQPRFARLLILLSAAWYLLLKSQASFFRWNTLNTLRH